MPELIPFKAEHAFTMVPREYYEERIEDLVRKEQDPFSFTIVEGGYILGCAGIGRMWDGVGQAWAFFSDDIAGHAFWLHRNTRLLMRQAIQRLGLHRVECVAACENFRNQRWLEGLGFWREHNIPVRKYTPDKKDAFRYEWVEAD